MTTNQIQTLLGRLGLQPVNAGAYGAAWLSTGGEELASHSPINGQLLAKVKEFLT